MNQNSANKPCINKTKQQIKLLIDGIDINNNGEVYWDLQYLLTKLKAQNQSKLRHLHVNDCPCIMRQKQNEEASKELFEQRISDFSRKYPTAGKVWQEYITIYPDQINQDPFELWSVMGKEYDLSGQSAFIAVIKNAHINAVCNAHNIIAISPQYIRTKYPRIKQHNLTTITALIESEKNQVMRKRVDLEILAEEMTIIMKEIGASYANIDSDGIVTIVYDLNPIVKVSNRDNAKICNCTS